MKITIIHGQNHKGSTYNIGRILLDSIEGEKDVSEFFLPRDLNHFCTGCYACIKNETNCPFYKEKNRILTEIEKSDLLIFTTPNYCLAPSAPMKSFIDLTFTYWLPHKPRECMFGKRAAVISTAAGNGTGAAIKTIANALFYWGVPEIHKYGVNVQAMSWDGVSEKKKEKIRRKMSALGKKLERKIQKSKKPTVQPNLRFMFGMMRSLQKAGMGSSPEEKEYWKSKGWLGRKRPWKKK